MPQPLIAPLAPNLELGAGCVVRVTALNASTGATVAGVVLSQVSIYVVNVGEGAASDLQSGPFLLVPGPSTA